MKKIIVLFFICIFLIGCATATNIVGRPISQENVDRIKTGKTTKEDILLWFGEPFSTTKDDQGNITFVYSYLNTSATCGVGNCDSNTQQQTLIVFIGSNGKVSKFQNTTGGGNGAMTLNKPETTGGN